MQEFQRGLLEDLRDQVEVVEARLEKAAADRDLRRHAAPALAAMRQVSQIIDQLSNDPRLNDARFDQQHRIILERLSEQVLMVKSAVLPPLERFSETDRRLTRLTAKLIEQVGYPMPAPLVVADSDAGYMTYPELMLVRVPAAEDTSLLALPDLVHELTHILMRRERGTLLGDFVNVLATYVNGQQNLPGEKPLSPQLFEQWRGHWLEEFVSDMVAVYACGPSFGSQHIRLISGLPSRAYQSAVSHPADEARVRGAIAVMRAMGRDGDAQDIEHLLSDYLPTTGESKPKGYDRAMPDVLIDALAQRVVAGCQQLGIRRYDSPQVSRPDDIVGAVNEAWNRFRSAPATFAKWQRSRLSMLWQQLGLGPAHGGATPPAPNHIAPPLRPISVRPPSSGFPELAA